MLRHTLLGLTAAVSFGGAAQACQSTYTVVEGDTLFTIAEDQIGDLTKWSLIFYNNPALQGGSLLEVPVGSVLDIPCPEGSGHTAPDPTPLQQADAELTLVTASNYAPFTDWNWPGHGMATELVNAALEESPSPVPYAIVWEDNWSKHLHPMLDEKQVDMGFPWFRPDCENNPTHARCVDFHFSDPLVDLVILLFARTDGSMTFESDADVIGKTLCRPAGYFTHDLDTPDRQWLSKGLITFVQPVTPDDCFNMLATGQVDAVAVNEFLGVEKMFELGLSERIAALQRPLSIQGMHVIISKKHWRGTTHLYRLNAGLATLKQSDRYNEIVSRHLAHFWTKVKG
jgi:polar amino acid transport system substrate-binding protein